MRRIILLIGLVLLSSCTLWHARNMEKAKVNLRSVDIEPAGSGGAKLLFGLEVENPNPFALKIDGVKYEVELGGRKLSTEEVNSPTEVAAKSSALIRLPLSVTYAALFGSIGDFLNHQTTSYRLKGSARVGILNLPFDEGGELKLLNGKVQALPRKKGQAPFQK